MGEEFSEKQYAEVLERCKRFKAKRDDHFGKKVYVQLVHEAEESDKLHITFDVYSKKLLYYLMDYALTRRPCPMPLFSYRFETVVDKKSCVYKEIKIAARQNNGWLEATLHNKNERECMFYGQLVWQCGEVESFEIGVKMQYGISDSEIMDTINRATEGFNKNISKLTPPHDIMNGNAESPSSTFYDVYLYTVGEANTTQIVNTHTKESLLVDCGIERKIQYRSSYLKAENTIKMLNPEYILLSHNHEDHYNLLFINGSAQSIALGLANMSALKQVIITDVNNGSLSQAVIKSVLKNKLTLINPNIYNYKYIVSGAFPNVYVEFGKCPGVGSCVGGLQSNFENDTGMIVSIQNNKSVVLTGDCSFDFIPAAAGLSNADYIVVPHHGGKVMMNQVIPMKKNCFAIVSSGFSSFYSGVGRQRQYDQGLFLNNCGVNVNSSLVFLQACQKPYYVINDV